MSQESRLQNKPKALLNTVGAQCQTLECSSLGTDGPMSWFPHIRHSYTCSTLIHSTPLHSQKYSHLEKRSWTVLVAQAVKNLPAMQKTWAQSLSQEDPLEKEMTTLSSIPAWRILWTEEPDGLQSVGSQELAKVGHDYTNTSTCLLLLIIKSEMKIIRWSIKRKLKTRSLSKEVKEIRLKLIALCFLLLIFLAHITQNFILF